MRNEWAGDQVCSGWDFIGLPASSQLAARKWMVSQVGGEKVVRR